MGNPGATEVKGSALIVSIYLVRKSIAMACSFAFLSQTWLVTMAARPAAAQMPKIPKATVASTNEKAAAPVVLWTLAPGCVPSSGDDRGRAMGHRLRQP